MVILNFNLDIFIFIYQKRCIVLVIWSIFSWGRPFNGFLTTIQNSTIHNFFCKFYPKTVFLGPFEELISFVSLFRSESVSIEIFFFLSTLCFWYLIFLCFARAVSTIILLTLHRLFSTILNNFLPLIRINFSWKLQFLSEGLQLCFLCTL